jgi:hypothetical protein
LPDIGIFCRLARVGKIAEPFNRIQDGGYRASGRIRVDLVEKRPQSRYVTDGVGRKNDHTILRGDGRGNSSVESQLATNAFTS